MNFTFSTYPTDFTKHPYLDSYLETIPESDVSFGKLKLEIRIEKKCLDSSLHIHDLNVINFDF